MGRRYIDCCKCKEECDCDRTFLGGCCDGEQWEDETDFIEKDEDTVEHIIFGLKAEIAEYKRKIDNGELVSKDWHDEKVLHLIKENAYWQDRFKEQVEETGELKAVIEQLSRNYIVTAYDKLRAENAKLKKEVDELKANRVIECHGMLKGCDMVNQAVKDTAKEILAKAPDETNADEMFICWIRERYGVKVE